MMPSNETPSEPRQTTKGWPSERRAAQAERIRQKKPWLHSTGPRTEAGKARAAMNATTHGMTGKSARALRDALKEQKMFLSLGNWNGTE